MSQCDECRSYDDDHFDGTVTEEEFDNNSLYEPNRYYYWHGDIQEDYQMPAGYCCLCEDCFFKLPIIEKFEYGTNKLNPKWNDDMGWYKPMEEIHGT